MTFPATLVVLYFRSMPNNTELNNKEGRVYRRALQRIHLIDREIAAETFPNARTLSTLLSVNPRTVKRDLEFLRSELNAPLVYDYFKRGFRYKKSGWTLPLQNLSEGEILAFFIAENALRFVGDAAQARQLKQALVKIAARLPERVSVNLATLGENLSFQNLPFISVEPELLQTLALSAANQETVEFDYYSPHNQKPTHRTADVHLLHNFIGDWYAISHDHEKKDWRYFNIGRMSNLQVTQKFFEIQKSWNPEEQRQQAFYMTRGGKLVTVEILFDSYRAQWIRERRAFHINEQREELKGGSLRLKFQIGEQGLEAVARFCLSYAGHCIAEKPEKLRKIIIEKIEAALSQHKS